MDKKITVLGSTGSIGTQTLEVAKKLGIKVCGLSAKTNIDLLERQAREFKPAMVAIEDMSLYNDLKTRLADTDIKVLAGGAGIAELAAMPEADTIVAAIVGIAGLMPVLSAIRAGKTIALANKETLVAGGEIVKRELKTNKARIIPVDSEHSAIFQCLAGNSIAKVANLYLTASGGPFRGKNTEDLKDITVQQALKHPNWSMGKKITIDSATLMNKGLEVIEAYWLFGIGTDRIKVVIHPQSIIHSMVEFIDGSFIAQMGTHDMKNPIQFALSYPMRVGNDFEKLDLVKTGSLTFEEPDMETFRCLKLAIRAVEIGGTMPAAINAANEEAVELFLNEQIKFLDIPRIIEYIITEHNVIMKPSLEDIFEVDRHVRRLVKEYTTWSALGFSRCYRNQIYQEV